MTCFSFLRSRKVPPLASTNPDIDEEISGIHVRVFTYKELKIATDNFSPVNKIGEGGFGPVYKGVLKDGKVGAIKVLSAESKQGVKEFMTEINVISEIEHENLVQLYGCCVEGNHRILVYNYHENNSLAQTLLGGGHSNIHFDWRMRSRICIGVARGLSFLHEEVRPHIVHRDIKASNILLDKDLTPKISDFGLAKLIPAYMTHVSTRVAGTIGYLAPEYAVRGQLTRKADIYSFGVLLVEIVSGRCNTNSLLPIGDQYILEKAWDLYQQNELVMLVDISLNGAFDPEEACRILKIALLCTQDNPKFRPSMPSVVKMLAGEMDVDESKITKPGLISDVMDLKIRQPKGNKDTKTSSSYNSSSASDSQGTMKSLAASSAASTFTRTEKDIAWKPPPLDSLKINVDAAFETTNPICSLGVVVRDHWGQLIMGAATKNFAPSPVVAEALAVREGTVLAANLGWDRIVVESDCQALVEACRGAKPIAEIRAIIEDINVLKHQFLVCTFRWTPRICNQSAHLVAQIHHRNNLPSDWTFRPPIPLARALIQDARCVPPRGRC